MQHFLTFEFFLFGKRETRGCQGQALPQRVVQHEVQETVLRFEEEERRRPERRLAGFAREETRQRSWSRERPWRWKQQEEEELPVALHAEPPQVSSVGAVVPQPDSPFPYEVREPTTKIGGRLADFYPAWTKITANKTVLSYISGAKILFRSTPTPALSSFAQPRFTEEESNQVDQFVEKLRLAQVI